MPIEAKSVESEVKNQVPEEQKVGYGRHATHRLSLSRETQVGPRGAEKISR